MFAGPTKWAVALPDSYAEDGDPLDESVHWFDSREEAETAVAQDKARQGR
jgi:hypothetical protein